MGSSHGPAPRQRAQAAIVRLSGPGVFGQALAIDLATSQLSMSNGFVMGLGF